VSRYDSVEVYRTVVVLEDYLWKKGKAFHMWSRRLVLIKSSSHLRVCAVRMI
jgi:hypothetical protein